VSKALQPASKTSEGISEAVNEIRHILNEPATNARIHEHKSVYKGGLTLCGKQVMLVQKSPEKAEIFIEEGWINPELKLFYMDTWDVGVWLASQKDGSAYPICLNCLAVIEKAIEGERMERQRDE